MSDILPGFSLIAIAISVVLSALISLIQTMELRKRVSAQMTGVRELAELSGVTDPRELQDVFGPPGIDRVWRHITLSQIDSAKRLPGYLMSDNRVDYVCVLIAMLALFTGHGFAQVGLVVAALAQIGGWMSAGQLPK